MTTVELNKADILQLLAAINKFEVDNFTLIKHDTSGIGYSLDMEFPYTISGTKVIVRAEVIGVDNW